MHTFGETGVPAFLAKLWRLVEDEETNDLIGWSSDGRSFIIQDQARFAKELLPLNYKHNNMASFIRQLNMYGFHKIASIDSGGLKFDRDEMEFSHPCFQQGHPYLLEHIKRKIAHPKTEEKVGAIKVEAVNHVLNEVKTMRGRQDSMDSRFSSIKQENEALWREVAILRQKHMKQQQIVNKLIQFLVTIVQPQRSGLGGMNKRHYQLMINDTPESSKKRNSNDTGPIIHELTEELLESAVSEEDQDEFPQVQSPRSGGSRSRNPSGTYLQEEDLDTEPESSVPAKRPKMTKSNSITEKATVIDYVIDYDTTEEQPSGSGGKGSDLLEATLRSRLQHRQKQQTEQLILEQQNQREQLEKEFRQQHQQAEILADIKKENADSGVGRQTRANTKKRSNAEGKSVLLAPKLIKQEEQEATVNDPIGTVDPMSFINMMDVGQEQANGASTTSIVASASDVNDPQHDASVARIEEFLKNVTSDDAVIDMNGKNMYSKEEFLTNEIPSELFDDGSQVSTRESPMLSGFNLNGGSSNTNVQFKQAQQEPTTSKKSNDETKAIVPKLQSNNVHPANILRFNSRDDFDNHLNTVESDLDTLKDLLRGDGYQIDPNSLMGHPADNARPYYLPQSAFAPETITKLFGNDDVLSYELNSNSNDYNMLDKRSSEAGSELISYEPCQADLSDLLDIDDESTIAYDKTGVSPSDVLGQ